MIYLDHNATTPVHPAVMQAMLPWFEGHWGNPSSVYGPGREARKVVNEARIKVARLVGAEPDQILFTSSATESINSAIHSAFLAQPGKRHIVTSAVEHSAVLSYCDYLKKYFDAEVTRLPVSSDGMLSIDALKDAIRPDTAIVSLIWANNETGVIWPVEEFAGICAERGVPFHADAVQAVAKISVSFRSIGADFLSLSGHKFGAPKGIGVLVMADPGSFCPMLVGGKQQNGLRGGTENVPYIVGLGVAAELAQARQLDAWKNVAALRDFFENEVLDRIDGAEINGATGKRLPNTSNIYLPEMDGDALVTFLDQKGICVSSGSACMESAITPSHVIQAMSGSHDRASESLRVSLGPETKREDLDQLLIAIEAFAEFCL